MSKVGAIESVTQELAALKLKNIWEDEKEKDGR